VRQPGDRKSLAFENPTQQEIEQAAKHAYAHDFIMQMPERSIGLAWKACGKKE
jgi:ABC-type multidrug transport system fused ATPase/permease subunit